MPQKLCAIFINRPILPVDHDIVIKSTVLPGVFHKDPADRMIVATARKLASENQKHRENTHVQ